MSFTTLTFGYLMDETTAVLSAGYPEPDGAVAAKIIDTHGGSATNFAWHMERLGAPVRCATHVGNDDHGRSMMTELRGIGVDVVPLTRGSTSRIVIAVDSNTAERSFIVDVKNCMDIYPSQVRSDWLRDVGLVFLTSYQFFYQPADRAALRLVDLAQKSGSVVALDTSAAGPLVDYGVDRYRELLARIQPALLLASRGEAEVLGIDCSQPSTVPEGVGLMVVHDGHHGATAVDNSTGLQVFVPSRTVAHVTDTTGAGDAFNAGVVRSLLGNAKDPADARAALQSPTRVANALRSGHRLASDVVQGYGSRSVKEATYERLGHAATLV